MTPPRRAVVVGGGIAGLAAAFALDQLAAETGEDLRLTVLEAGEHWGGKIRTERRDGFVIEAGPDTFVSTKPWGVALCRQLGLEGRLQGADVTRRKVFVLFRHRLVELPEGLAMMVPSRLGPMLRTSLLSPLAKLRLALDLVLPPKSGEADESLGSFMTRRFGRQAYERLIEPLMSGIYAGDGDRLSLLSTFPFLREWEVRHGGVVRAALRQSSGKGAGPGSASGRSVFLTPQGGLGEIVEALLRRLARAELLLNTPVSRIVRSGAGYRVETGSGEALEAEMVIVAAPAYAAADMLRPLDARLAEWLDGVEYVSTATVSMALRETDLPRPLDGHGYVIPRIEGRRALACTWSSTKFPHRAPPGHALLRVFIGRAGMMDDPDLGEASLTAIAREEIAETMGIEAEPTLVRVARWPRSMPQYNLGHAERLRAVAARLGSLPGLRLAGAAYGGIGIPDCIHSGQQAAAEAWSALTGAPAHALRLATEVDG